MNIIKEDVKIRCLSGNDINSEHYKTFLKDYYKDRFEVKHNGRFKWYQQFQGYQIVIAVYNGVILGQSSAVRCDAVINGKHTEFWWSADTFILEQYRGVGAGKLLQRYLHENTPNFSSAAYSKINGIIKCKLGSNAIFNMEGRYYPVSTLFIPFLRMASYKFIKHDPSYIPAINNLYYYLNKLSCRALCDGYSINISRVAISGEQVEFIGGYLKSFDFYIDRNYDYLKLKYEQNPSVECFQLELRKGETLIGLVYFSDVYNYSFINIKVRHFKILDWFISPECDISNRIIIGEIMLFFKNRNIHIDGFISVTPIPKCLNIKYKTSDVLSTIKDVNIKHPYISMSDHDMEQMR